MTTRHEGGRLREAAAGDLQGLAALEVSAFERPWSTEQLRSQLDSAANLTLLAEAASGEIAGYATFSLVAGEAELLRIAVRPAARGRGLAGDLLGMGLRRLAARRAEVCHLEVREDNAPAIALYRGRGFEQVGRRHAYYPDKTAALLFRLSLLAAKP